MSKAATLNPGVVMIGLNVASRSLSPVTFCNFHDASPVANDFKIRFVFEGSQFWGAYMTDVIKDFPESDSGRLLDQLRANPAVIPLRVDKLRAELSDLGPSRPFILAFGKAAYSILHKHLQRD